MGRRRQAVKYFTIHVVHEKLISEIFFISIELMLLSKKKRILMRK